MALGPGQGRRFPKVPRNWLFFEGKEFNLVQLFRKTKQVVDSWCGHGKG